MRRRRLVIGVDIGGTKIKAGAVEIGGDGISTSVAGADQIVTPRRAPRGFYDEIAELVRRLCARLEKTDGAVVPIVAVAHPGRFLPDGTLARGTTPNLGTSPGQFDGLSPTTELRRRLGWNVFAENDAVAQMRCALNALLRNPAIRRPLLSKTVVYLGPGTGMGGGVARVSEAGEVSVITDGHFFDMQVPGYGDGTLTAEEIFTGPAFARLAAEAGFKPATAEHLSRLLSNRDVPTSARRIAELGGHILACLIHAIHDGRIAKVRLEHAHDGRILRHVDEPDRAWSASDRDAVRGSTRFILGGSVGTSRLGREIRQRALGVLKERGLVDILIFHSPIASADAGLLGAVCAIPADQLRVVR